MYLNLATQLEKNNYRRLRRLGVALFYMRDSADCKLRSFLTFSLTEIINSFAKSDFFSLLDLKSNKILHRGLLRLARCTRSV